MIIINVFSPRVGNLAVESEEGPLCCCRCCCCCRGRLRDGHGDVVGDLVTWAVDLDVVLVVDPVVGDLEDHLHVVGGTTSPNTSV